MHCCCCSACWSCGPEAWPVGEGQCCCRNHPVTRWSTLSSRTQVSVTHTHNRMSVSIQPITFPISFHNYTNFFAPCNYLYPFSLHKFPISVPFYHSNPSSLEFLHQHLLLLTGFDVWVIHAPFLDCFICLLLVGC